MSLKAMGGATRCDKGRDLPVPPSQLSLPHGTGLAEGLRLAAAVGRSPREARTRGRIGREARTACGPGSLGLWERKRLTQKPRCGTERLEGNSPHRAQLGWAAGRGAYPVCACMRAREAAAAL